MRKAIVLAVIFVGLLAGACASGPEAKRDETKPVAQVGQVELIPRAVLFDNPEKTAAKLSPDGKYLSWLAPVEGVLNVWVQTLGEKDAKAITKDTKRGIRTYSWAKSSKYLLYLQDQAGNENWRIHRVDPATGQDTELTPFPEVRAGIVDLSKKHPNSMLITLNKRDPKLFDVHRLNLETGEISADTQNPGNVIGWIADNELKVRAATATSEDGGTQLLVRDTIDKAWRTLRTWSPLEQGGGFAFTADNKAVIATGNKDGDTERLYSIDVASGKISEIFSHPSEDYVGLLINEDDLVVEAVATERLRKTWKVLNDRVAKDLDILRKLSGDDFSVVSRSADDSKWVVAVEGDTTGVQYHIYNRKAGKTELLFDARPKLTRYTLAPMKPLEITARDGLKLVSYLTKPIGAKGRLPMVLFVHGGPWGRDRWGYHRYAQWLANRGYAVLQVNFRGSAGFGKALLNAGNKEWGRKMQHDLTDAVKWAIESGEADPKQVGIMGGSDGGYAALAGVTFTPDLYEVAVDIVGPSNIITLLKSVPPYWKPLLAIFQFRVGDLEKDKAMLEDRSPLNHVDKIKTPLFIFQGANDPRVKQAESDQIVKAIRDRKGRVDYVVYTDEGHGFARPPNQLDFIGRAEQFLAEHLGGRTEPFSPIEGSSAQVK